MKHIKVFCFAFGLALCSSMAARGQNAGSLSSRIMEALKTKEPGWKPIGVVENRPLLVPSERSILYAVWTSPKSRSEDVNVSVYSVENHDEAAAWLGPFRKKQVATGWQVSTYQIGDEGYLSKYKDGERFEIEFRKANVVAKIAGNDLSADHGFHLFRTRLPSAESDARLPLDSTSARQKRRTELWILPRRILTCVKFEK